MIRIEEKKFEMPFLKNIGIVMTYKCQVMCPHCQIEAGPHRSEEVTPKVAFNWIRQIANYRDSYVKVLSLTGGEPFYNIEYLKLIADYGEQNGLFVTVVTNAYWASSREEAIRILRSIPSIKMLSFSTDVYHQKSIPFGKVRNAILAAQDCDIPYTVAVCTENKDDIEYNKVLDELNKITSLDTIRTAVTFPVGRALKKITIQNHQITEEPPGSACISGSSPIIFPDGKVVACVGPVIELKSMHPLVLGNLKEKTLSEILDDSQINPILHAIRIWGPQELITLLKQAGYNNYLPQKYIKNSICNVCYSLMSNDNIVKYLFQLSKNDEFIKKVAYARAYYLNEIEMYQQIITEGS